MTSFRNFDSADISRASALIEKLDLFPPELLGEMTASYLNGNPDKEIWAVAEEESVLQCVAFCAQEKLTNGTWNLYLLAVDLASQRHGVGTAMVSWIERRLCDQQARLLLVETSSLPEFEPARRFYLRYGFEQEGLIRDFYDTGNHKLVFRKLVGL